MVLSHYNVYDTPRFDVPVVMVDRERERERDTERERGAEPYYSGFSATGEYLLLSSPRAWTQGLGDLLEQLPPFPILNKWFSTFSVQARG